MITLRKGDLLKSGANVIFHGCNCFNTMGAGIARQIKHKYPHAAEADRQTQRGSKTKLGTLSYAKTQGIIVCNLYTQYRYGNGNHLDYHALTSALTKMKTRLDRADPEHLWHVAGPRIGAGLAGGDWNKIESIINQVFPHREILIYHL